jgi:uncharacterized protein
LLFARKNYRQLLLGMTGTVCFSYLATCLGLYYSQRYLIFNPKETIALLPNAPTVDTPYQEVWIPVAKSSERLNAWWIEGKPTSRLKDKVILYFLGRSGNKSSGVFRAEGFYDVGLSVLAVDYRGFGNSDGQFPSEKQVYEDALAAWHYLTKERGIPPKNIFIYGESLGGAVAVDLAVKRPDAGGVIVQSSFTSMEAIARKQARWLSWFPLRSIVTEKFDSLSKVSKLKIPVLFLHGKKDDIVPYSMSQELYQAAPEPKSILIVPNGNHYSLYQGGKYFYLTQVKKLIDGKITTGN